jgi:Thioesterase superfamily./CBS domain.
LFRDDTVERWFELNRKSNHTRFPVIDRNGKLEGIVTAKDVLGQDRAKPIEKIMTKNPIVTTPQMSVAYASHMMIWEGIELLPVVDDSDQLLGILSRQDVLKALQTHQRQPHVGETIDNLISRYLNDTDLEAQGNGDVYTFEVTPQMTTPHGTISYGVITTLITEAVQRSFRRLKKGELVVETLTFYFLRPVQMESIIEIRPNILETGRKFGKAEIGIHCEGKVVCKAMIMVQFIDR